MNTIFSRASKNTQRFFFALAAMISIVGGFFAANAVFAAVSITPASGAANISIDTTSAIGGTGNFVQLSGPTINEASAGDIAVGTHTITLPEGWEFDTSSTVTVMVTAGDISPIEQVITPGANSFTFTVSNLSTEKSSLAFVSNRLKVRPTGTVAPTTGHITYSGSGISGVDSNTNFGTLSTVPGVVTKLAFTAQPGNATYGSLLGVQPIVKTKDQFGNNSVNGLAANKIVTLSKTSGNGELTGTVSLDIGTSDRNGIATFSGLTVNRAGTDNQLTATSEGYAPAVSGSFEITKKVLTATIVADTKVYDGTSAATFSNPSVVGAQFFDVLTLTGGTATFNNANVGGNKTVTASGLVLAGDNSENYTYDGIGVGTANITAKPITVTPVVGQTKVYGDTDPVYGYTFSPSLIGGDTFTGTLGRSTGNGVDTYSYTLGGLSAGGNYALSLDTNPGTFAITPKTLVVTATADNKVYDAGTGVVVALSDNRISGDVITLGHSESFTDKNAGNGKTVNVTGISITGGDDANNYVLGNTEAVTTANITPAPVTVSFTTHANKTYNGTSVAEITGRTLAGVIGSDVVNITEGSANFEGKHIGNNKTVTANGFVLTGTDKNNYAIGTINTTTGNVVARPLTITAVTGTKTYDGTVVSNGTPVVSSTFNPDIATGDTANFVQTYDTQNAETGKTLTPSGNVTDGNNGANYSYHFVGNTTGVIEKAPLSITAENKTKIYGTSNPVFTATYNGFVNGETFAVLTTPVSLSSVAVDASPVGSYAITASGAVAENYNIAFFPGSLTITPALITVNADAKTKVYGESDPIFTSTVTSGALIGTDVLTGTLSRVGGENVGTYAISSTLSNSNYTINFVPSVLAITPRPITVTAVETTKVYDGTAVSAGTPAITPGTLKSGDTANFVQIYNNKNAVSGKMLTPSGSVNDGNEGRNYVVTFTTVSNGEITQKTVTVTAQAGTKVYDGTNTSSTAPIVSGLAVDDTVGTAPTQTYDNENVGTGKPLTADGLIVADGNGGANYHVEYVTNGAGAITSKGLTVIGAVTTPKTYNGNEAATVDFSHASLSGKIDGDVVSLNSASYSAEFDTKNVGTGKTVTVSRLVLSGVDSGNYSLAQPALTGVISPAILTVTATASNKTYDGGATATATLSGNTIENDVVTLGYTAANFANPNVGDNKVVDVSGISITGGTDAGNYTVGNTTATASANITTLAVTITPNGGQGKVYGGNDPVFAYTPAPTLFGTDSFGGSLSRVSGSDVRTYSYELGTLSAGTNYTLSLSTIPGTFAITPASLTVTAANKIKATGSNDPEFTYAYTGLVNNDTTTSFSGSLSRDEGETTGNYAINRGTLLAGGNYAIGTYHPGALTIKNAPAVLSHTPSVNAVGVSVSDNITITFTEPVIVNDGDITVSPSTSFSMSGSGTNVITLDPVTEWNSNIPYTITITTGVKDSDGLSAINSSWSFTTAVSYSIPLTKGWNLVSLPVIPVSTAIDSVLGTAKTSVDNVWSYDAVTEKWSAYHANGEENTSNLTNMTAGYGYWVNYTNDASSNLVGSGNLIQEGNSVPPSRKLGEGWNLIGYYQRPSTTSVTAEKALYNNLNGVWTLLFGYDNTNKYMTTLSGNDSVKPGQAFWVWLNSARSYTMGNI